MRPCHLLTSSIVLGIALRLLLGQQLGQLLVLVISQLACGIENVQLGAHALQIAAFDHAFTGTVQHRFVLSGAAPHLKMLSSSWQRVLLSDPQLQQGQPIGLVNVQRIGICLGALHRSKSLIQCRGRLRCIGRAWLRAGLNHNVSLRLVVHAPQSLANGSRCIVGGNGIHNGRIGIALFLRDDRLRDFCSGFDLHLHSPHFQRP
nr:MAG TPA: hypothetical protein [Caudoviricetes sp.]